jgi:hypothetical protein
MKSIKGDNSFSIENYLPKNFMSDMSILDDEDNSSLSNPLPQQISLRHQMASFIGLTNSCRSMDSRGNLPVFPEQIYNFQSLNPNVFIGSPESRTYVRNQNINDYSKVIINTKNTNSVRYEKNSLESAKSNKALDTKLCEFLKSQKGSRIYQRKLKKFSQPEVWELLISLKSHFGELLTNIYGNYLCQKLYTVASLEQRKFLLDNVRS